MIWKWTEVRAKDGTARWTKVPFNPVHFRQKARSNDPSTWGAYDAAVGSVTAGKADGIGLQLLNSGLAALDLDHCVDLVTEQIATWALAHVNDAVEADAYVEKTVSGTGLRILGRVNGEARKIHRKFKVDTANGAALEVYHNAERYIVVTGMEITDPCQALPETDFFHQVFDRYESRANGEGKKAEEPFTGFDFNTARQQGGEIEDIIRYWVPEGGRSEAFGRCVWALAAAGDGVDAIEARLREHPAGIAAKYLTPLDRLAKEIARSYAKWKREQSVNGSGAAQEESNAANDGDRSYLLLSSG